MRRFWKEVTIELEAGGWGVRLDNRPVRTPARVPLLVPTEALAQSIADEWGAVTQQLDARAMPLTGLANAAIDRVAPHKDEFAQDLARYAEADLACYRAEGPSPLVERQAASWDALLDWGRRRYDVDFTTTCGVTHVDQPFATVDRLAHAVASLDAFRLTGLSPLVTIGGSLLAALAVLEKAMIAEEAWEAVTIDDRWQLEQWGSDEEAEAALENRRRDFIAAARFLELLDT